MAAGGLITLVRSLNRALCILNMAYSAHSSCPPSYTQSLQPVLLSLDGGGTRIFCQLQILCELMHRLAWDLKLISSRPSVPQKGEVYPADCFDYIGAGGCGSIVAFLLASGLSAQASLEAFLTLSPILANTLLHPESAYPNESLESLGLALDACLPRHEQMLWNGQYIIDVPARTNVWIANAARSQNAEDAPAYSEKQAFSLMSEKFVAYNEPTSNGSGTLIRKGDPIRLTLLPFVLAEVEREMRGQQVSLDHTFEFLQAVCPVFNDCSLLLSLGSGEAPVPVVHSPPPSPPATPVSTSTASTSHSCSEPSWFTSFTGWLYAGDCSCESPAAVSPPTTTLLRPALLAPGTLGRAQSRALNGYIPTRAYGRSYIRMSPDLTTRTNGTLRPGLVSSSPSARVAWPGDWEPQHFSEHRMLTTSYCAKVDTGVTMDRVVDILGRRGLPGVDSVNVISSPAGWCVDIVDKKRYMDALVFESAGYRL